MKSRFAGMLVLVLMSCAALAQEKPTPPLLPPGYYIVVAAYLRGQEGYVQRYTDKVNQDGYHAKSGYDQGRKFYYVYLDYYTDFNTSIQKMLKARKEGGFLKAWVRIMKDPLAGQNVNLLVEKKPDEPASVVSQKEVETKPAEEIKEVKTTTVSTPVTQPAAVTADKVNADVVENATPDPVYRPLVLTNTPVFLSLQNPNNDAVVEGEVEVIDAERSKLITKVKGNDYLTLPDPKSNSGKLTLIGSSFGYRKEQREINYKSTEADTLQHYISLVGKNYVIKFDMVRLHRGDIATLYNVYFYNDAAVMLPESKYELGKLLAMMKENSKYRIMLHGHTNGRAGGTIITMGEAKNFFELTPDVKKGIGSAKDLSRERAEVIKDWLIANGIAADRMDIKAWGGNRMIHDKNSVNARKNVRVEVEVLQD